MTMYRRFTLHHPDDQPAGGTPATADSTAPAATVSTAGATASPSTSAPQAEPKPAQRTVSEDEWNRQNGKVSAYDKTFNRFKAMGVNSMDEAVARLEKYNRLQTDPRTSQVLDALASPQPARNVLDPSAPVSNLTTENLQALLGNVVEQRFQLRDQESAKAEHQRMLTDESRLLSESVNDPSLKPLFGETSFEGALLRGEGTPEAQMTAALIDTELSRLAERYPNGQPKPVTNPQIIAKARENVLGFFRRIKANAIIEASTQPVNGQQPLSEGNVPRDPNAPQQSNREQQRAAYQATYEAELKRLTGGQGLPQSQLLTA